MFSYIPLFLVGRVWVVALRFDEIDCILTGERWASVSQSDTASALALA